MSALREDAPTEQATEILQRLDGVLFTDSVKCGAYISDASIYRRRPVAVLEARSTDDIIDGITLAKLNGWSVTSRGGGTSVAGNAIGDGLVIDTSRHMNRIVDIDADSQLARVQPGVVCDQLRSAAAGYGLTYGPDPSTHSRCTIGGMVANNACGSHSVAWGTSASNLVGLRMLLHDGREVQIDNTSIDDSTIASMLRGLREEYRPDLRKELARFPRQVSGYGLHYLLEENGFDVARAVAGSEGTLGVITELTVKLVEKPAATALAVLAFPSVFDAAAAAPGLRRSNVMTIEGMGSDLLDALRSRPGQENAGSELPGVSLSKPGEQIAGGWLFCEVAGECDSETLKIGRELVASVPGIVDSAVITDATEARRMWRIREASAGIATRTKDGGEAWPGWEDSAVPPEHLASYLRGLYQLMDEFYLKGIPFGHFGEGCIHIRLSFDPGTDAGLRQFRAFMEAAADLVAKHGGSLSGEHGDGRARSELLPRMYSDRMLEAFRAFKDTFDPQNLFNPGILVDPDPIDQELRPGPDQTAFVLRPVSSMTADRGAFVNAVNRCVGVGSCRSTDGAMCPSFQITRDEIHSTRGRARLLSEMLRDPQGTRGERAEDVKEALDLCLSCKACASECPVNVDMATYKSEFLHSYHQTKRRPMAHFTMGWLPAMLRILHSVPGAARLASSALALPPLERLAKKLGGVDVTRPMIAFENRSFQELFRLRKETETKSSRSHHGPRAEDNPDVVLWPDTFTNHLNHGPGRAAVHVLETLGANVLMPQQSVCCGLTLHSTGQLTALKTTLSRTLDAIEPMLKAKVPIVVLEPSCFAMLKHDAVAYLPDDSRAAELANLAVTLGEYIFARTDGHLPDSFAPLTDVSASAISQVHCHERSVGNHQPTAALLKKLGVREETIETGCCGMAGNWGYEPGHAELSFELGERELFPAIRERSAGELVLADGYSCRTHIEQGTGERGMHLAEVLELSIALGNHRDESDKAKTSAK